MTNATQQNGQKPKRVEITLPEIYKQVDESVWEELEKYIFQGFLVSPAIVSGKSFIFKTLNHYELRNIDFMRPAASSAPEVHARFRAAFIAYSIFMVDGNNALFDRPRHITRLIKVVAKIAPNLQDEIVKQLATLNEMAHRLVPLVEPYAYENRSRYRWLQMSTQPIHSTLSTGIAGTDELGMNSCQQTWVALNKIIDKRDLIEADWNHAKFVGSCMAGKGMRAIDEKDRSRREKERVDREELKLKVLYQYLNRKIGKEVGSEEPVPIQLPDGRQAQVVGRFRAESAEELRDQLAAALSGEKDYHDLVIDAKDRELRHRAELIEQEKKQYYRAPPSYPELGGGSSRVIGGKKEADEYLKRMQDLRNEQLERSRKSVVPKHENSDTEGEEE